MSLRGYFYSRRGRILAGLAALAMVTLALAVLALNHRAARLAPKYEETAFLPGLAHALNAGEVSHIRIQSKKGTFTVVFVPTKGWVLPESGNFPAAFEVVKQTLVSLAALQTVEPKTDDPALYAYVGLDAPPQGEAVRVTLSNDKGNVLADLLAGKSSPLGDDTGLFVRKINEKQSWLVRSPAPLKTQAADWMDKTVVAIDRARVSSVTIEPQSGPGYTVSRNSPDDTAFAVAPLPKGRVLSYAGAGESVALALADFGFDDIRRSTEFDFTSGSRMVVRTFDGLSVTVNVVEQDGASWVRLSANAEPGHPAAAKEALAINAHTVGWAFKLPSFKTALFAPPLEGLLKPKGS